mgnify:CR=1 FL=1
MKLIKNILSKLILIFYDFFIKIIFFDKINFISIDVSRIGNFAYSTEHFFRRMKLNNNKKKYIAISQNSICNNFLFKMFSQKILIIKLGIRIHTYLKKSLKKSSSFHIDNNPYNDYEAFNKIDPTLTINNEIDIIGKNLLKKLGIPEDSWFVCFHARTSNYLNNYAKKLYGKKFDFSYQQFRNCDINNFTDSMKFIISKGGYVVLMGRDDDFKLKFNHEKIINYSQKNWSEFGDIYLSAKCKMFIGSNSGLICVPFIFNRPVLLTNWNNLCGFLPNKNLVRAIPVKIWSIKEKRYLTYGEIFKKKIWNFNQKKQYIENNLEVHENTREEIFDATVEFYDFINNKNHKNEKNKKIQNQFRNLILSDHPSYNTPIAETISINFLEKNIDLVQ